MNDIEVVVTGGTEMTLEYQLIQKEYYQIFINEMEQVEPIRVLGDAYQEELQKDMADLTAIRFAQGELYFHYKDYEAAIFKWETITGELGPWAKKNIADAYFETGLLSNAEDLYLAIETNNPTLNTEIALELFELYIERGKIDSAIQIIKKIINLNPDYTNVTQMAREFFETQLDWKNAVELANNEAKRTGSLDWFETVNLYVEKGVTKNFAPNYFLQALFDLFVIDQKRFEQLTVSLWVSYKNEENYFTWLKEVNHLLLNLDIKQNEDFQYLSKIHKETYFSLISGNYSIKKLEELIPDLLTNWLRLGYPAETVLASAAVLSWNELFPASISMEIVSEAERLLLMTENNMDELEECLSLFESILDWAKAHDMGENNRLKWMVEQLIDFDTQHMLVIGFSGCGKSTFVNAILGEEVQDSPTSTAVLFRDSEELCISEITDFETSQLSDLSKFQERMDRRRNAFESIIEFKQPIPFLQEQRLTLLDTPGMKGTPQDRSEVLEYLHVADTVLFVLDANTPFTDKERATLAQIHDLAPNTPVHFILNKMDTIPTEQDAYRIFDETKVAIHSFLPDARLFAFSSQYESRQQLAELREFIQSNKNIRNIADKRLAMLLFFIRSTITSLLEKRIDVENQLIDSVRWNEEVLMKLNGAVNQLKDAESQKATTITRSYKAIKESIQNEIAEVVPKMLQDCAELITDDSSFINIHVELNNEMNNRIQDYLEQVLMPKYYTALQGWITSAEEEFEESQAFLEEMSEGFNALYGEDRINPACDFRVLDDWHRDTDRMTSHFKLDKVNILLRNTPSQLLLKSAGKLFGAITQNKAMLNNRYKSFVKNEQYSETVTTVIDRFFQQFELFEKSLERDITMFFRSPHNVLNQAVEEARSEIAANQDILKKMNTNPEMFRDPLTLFEVRLRQFEWMTVAGKGVQTIY
ncbi:dynamin family protein [Neobacillus sp. FSL H8-0543]|uniref:dynamin family protein n=1 Tax=Neobacillus sp. FSL H8-0543 TaxID=2954672 RepID=UPI0031599034